jgi:hypothetical protein
MATFPGLPALPSSVSLLSDIVLLTSDALGLLTGFAASPWGIFLDGQSVVQADNVVSVTYNQDWTIADFPIEDGGFESYDKVDTPFSARVRFSSGGSQSNRQALFDSIAAIAGDLNLYDVVTPEVTYSSCNIQGYSVSRTATNGVGLIIIEVKLLEVRVDATTTFTNTKSPTSQAQTNDGTVQSSDSGLTSGQQNDISTGLA